MAEPGAVSFTLDGRPAEARPGELIISAAERSGVYIPRFCYHPRMEPVGMCRMCLVEVAGPRGPSLQPACFVSVGEGMEVTTTSAGVKKAQDGVLEFLLVNHPLDCPVCDKGGECPLQDQTLAFGPGETRFIEEKRHFEKPIAISDLVLLDRERCIQCARCTRFAEEVAGEAQIDFAGRGEDVEVATFPEVPFSSYFSGNTVQICPVGALTATPYRFSARPWDLDQVESTCTTCAFGCRVAVQSSTDRLTRLLGIDADPVNQGWLCDKGRFAFEAVNGDQVRSDPNSMGLEADPAGHFEGETSRRPGPPAARLTDPMVRKDGELVPVSWGEALAEAAEQLTEATRRGGKGAVGLIGGARCTNEGAYAWAKLAKAVLGTDSVDAQLADGLPAELVLGLPRATIDQAATAKVVLLLAGDVREELPVLFLRLRAAALSKKTALVELSAGRSALSPYAAVHLGVRPGESPELVRALVEPGASAKPPAHPEGPSWVEADLTEARRLVAEAGADGEGVVVVLGRPSLAEADAVTTEAARRLAAAWPKARFLPALRRGNVMGALDMGLAPGLLPGRVSLEAGRDWFAAAWGSAPVTRGLDTAGMLRSLVGDDSGGPRADQGRLTALLLVGVDLLDDFPDRSLAERALERAEVVIAVAGQHSTTLDHADVVLPVAVAHERPGTTTNIEGRVSRLGQKVVPPGAAWADWMIAVELAAALHVDLGVTSSAALTEEIARLAPAYAGLSAAVLGSPRAGDGVVVPLAAAGGRPAAPEPIDPMALPGVESVERQGAPPRVGLTEEAERPAQEPTADGRPALLGAEAGGDGAPHVPPPDSYSLRLVSGRRLYDRGAQVAGSPSLAPLAPAATAQLNPYDLDRLGLSAGQLVRVRSARGDLELPAAPDPHLVRGVLAVDFNLAHGGGAANVAATLIDASAVVNDVRLETPS